MVLKKESIVVDDLIKSSYKVIRKNLLSTSEYKNSKSDSLVRSLIRHDSDKLAEELLKLLK